MVFGSDSVDGGSHPNFRGELPSTVQHTAGHASIGERFLPRLQYWDIQHTAVHAFIGKSQQHSDSGHIFGGKRRKVPVCTAGSSSCVRRNIFSAV